jgi:hypothetical protein
MTARPGHLAGSAHRHVNGTGTLRGVCRWPERSRLYVPDLGLHVGAGEGSGRRESNPHDQLGRSVVRESANQA